MQWMNMNAPSDNNKNIQTSKREQNRNTIARRDITDTQEVD